MYIHDTQDARNFKALRLANGITQKEVAKRAGYNRDTVIQLEACSSDTKDETYENLYRALVNLIEERPKRVIHDMVSYRNIHAYLSENRMTVKEFSGMCGFHPTTFAPCYFKNGVIPDSIINKIKAATGWTDDQIKNGDLKGGNEMSYVPVLKKSIEFEDAEQNPETEKKYGTTYFTKLTSQAAVDIDPEIDNLFCETSDKQIKNERYACTVDRNTGEKTYICEYDEVITRHRTKTITREEFLKEV